MLRLLIVLVCCLPALAQSPDSATVQGRVVDPSQAAIEGVTISVTNTVTGFQRTTRSDSSGSFAFAGLPALGGYNLEISQTGLRSPEAKHQRIRRQHGHPGSRLRTSYD